MTKSKNLIKKCLWNVYDFWDDRLRSTREYFNFILDRTQPYIKKASANILTTSTESDRPLELIVYRFSDVFSSHAGCG